MNNYIVITPFKNEIRNLPQLSKSIAGQSILPSLWLLVDDGSTDGSLEFVRHFTETRSWARYLQLDSFKKKREIGLHYSGITKIGFDCALDICRKAHMRYDYIALVDADMVLGADYFEKLIAKFATMDRLGIVSGIVMSRVGEKVVYEKEPPEWPCGAARIWSKECFENTGWSISRAPDSVSTVRAMLCGYETRSFPDVIAWQSRLTYSGSGYWAGYMDLGKTRYYLGYTPMFAIFASFKYLIEYPHIGIIPFLIGYFGDFYAYKNRIADGRIIDFFKKRLTQKLARCLGVTYQ